MKKPKVKLSGQNGNIFNLLGIATKALRKAGKEVEANKMLKEAVESHSYDEAIQVIMKYVEVM